MTEKKKRILYIHNTVTNYRVPYFNRLAELSDLTLALFQFSDNEKIYKDKSRISELKNCKIYTDLKAEQSEIEKRILENQFDVIILPCLDDFTCYQVFNHFAKFKKYAKISVAWEMWEPIKIDASLYKKLKKYGQRPFRKMALKKIDFALSSSGESEKYLQFLGVPSSNIYGYWNAARVPEIKSELDLRKKLGIKEDEKIVLSLGRIIKRKGLDILLEAFAKIYKSHRLHLVIVGDGEELSTLKKQAKDLNLGTSVTFVGKVEPELRGLYFSQANLFVIPSIIYKGFPEPWGLTVNEALQFSVPVVTTTAVGASILVQDGKNGIIVQENNVTALSDGISIASKMNKDKIVPLNYTPQNMAEIVYGIIVKKLSEDE